MPGESEERLTLATTRLPKSPILEASMPLSTIATAGACGAGTAADGTQLASSCRCVSGLVAQETAGVPQSGVTSAE